jgi:NAD(P)-dependent dehydrogenase (short-subunit alcohol dehydrogenase family)
MQTETYENTGALVTGCSRGIGRAIALRLARDGFHVVLNDLERQRDALESLRSEIQDAGGQASIVLADVSDPEAIKRLAQDATEATGGRIRVLVNNAGVLSVSSVDDLTPEEWDRMYDVNVRGTFLVSQALLPHLRTQDNARIVNIASIGGKKGAPGQIHYCSSKAAVISFTQILAEEVAKDGILVNAVCPGIIDTEMGRNNYRDEESLAKVKAKTALGRVGLPEDVSGTVSFFCGPDSGFITGQSLNVDGGIIFH